MKTPIAPLARRPAAGFTLIEIMITIAILAILLMVAAPSFQELVMNARITAIANDLMADLNLARSEAVKRGVRVYLCTSNTGTGCTATAWSQGWMVFADANQDGAWDATELPLKTRAAVDVNMFVTVAGDAAGTGGSRFLPYRPSGVSTPAGGAITFFLCDIRNTANPNFGARGSVNKGRTVTINATGRPVVTPRTCAATTG